ncbi:recombinase family protein [Actinomadura citrea]|uniref:recombinase family protein n=1 Tax=Actinomadura citrea TaxID=46158 RepID=UPI003CE5684F
MDTSTAIGRVFFQILGAIAEFEHALMSDRTLQGDRRGQDLRRHRRPSVRRGISVSSSAARSASV